MGTTKLVLNIGYQLFEIFLSLLEVFISIIFSILLLPLLAFFWLFNQVIRGFISIILYYEYLAGQNDGLRVKLISNGVDGIWSYQKPGNSRNVIIVYVYESEINLESFRSNYLRHIINHGSYYAKLKKIFISKYGYYCWKDTAASFSINNHVKYLDGYNCSDNSGESGNIEIITESQLKQIILPKLAKDMDENKPQWEEIIIPYFQYDVDIDDGSSIKSARIYRSHHAYMDGGSTLMLSSNMYTSDGTKLQESTALTSTSPTFPYMVNPLIPPKIPAWKLIIYKFNCIILGLTTVFKILYEASQIRSPFLMSSYSGKQLFSLSKPIPLCNLKEIKEITHTSLPTILSSIIGSSSQSLAEVMSLNQSTLNSTNIINADSSSSSVSIGLVGAILPYPNIKPQNRFTVVNFKVSTSCSKTKLENLKKTQSAMTNLTNSPNGYVNYILFHIFGKCPGFIIQFMLKKAGTPIIYSNTPWAAEKVKLWDNVVEDVFGWMPLLTTAGIGILTVSYFDTIKFCVIADESCLTEKEITFLTEELNSQFQELLGECRRVRNNCNNTLVCGKNGTLLV